MMSLLLGSVAAQAMTHGAVAPLDAVAQSVYAITGLPAISDQAVISQSAYVVTGKYVDGTLSGHEQSVYVITN